MRRIAAPMIGGLTAPLLSMLVLPAAFHLLVRRRLRCRAELVHWEPTAFDFTRKATSSFLTGLGWLTRAPRKEHITDRNR